MRWMATALNDDDERIAAMTAEGEAQRACLMRAVACRKLHKKDLRMTYKRALRRPLKGSTLRTCLPGTRVYFWSPKIGKGRQRRDAGAAR